MVAVRVDEFRLSASRMEVWTFAAYQPNLLPEPRRLEPIRVPPPPGPPPMAGPLPFALEEMSSDDGASGGASSGGSSLSSTGACSTISSSSGGVSSLGGGGSTLGNGGGGGRVMVMGSGAATVLRDDFESRETYQTAPTISATTSKTHGSGLLSLRFFFCWRFPDIELLGRGFIWPVGWLGRSG